MRTITRNMLKLAVALLVLVAVLGAGFQSSVAYAATCSTPTVPPVDLWAKSGNATLFGATSVPIYGYATAPGDPASLPNPVLDFTVGNCVQITLHNVDVPTNTSLLFQGQEMIPDITGVPAGGDTTYTFTVDNPGTYLYEAGLTPGGQYQVAMGMYGALIVRAATAGQAYDDLDGRSAYDQENILVLSEVDTALNTSGSPQNFDMRNYSPQYFLINGKASPDTATLVGNQGESVLMRYVNAGIQAHSMSTLGVSQTIIAQDGNLYNFSHQVVAETIATGQTLDTIVSIPGSASVGDQFALYDANMLLHNNSAANFGGMLALLTVGTGTPAHD